MFPKVIFYFIFSAILCNFSCYCELLKVKLPAKPQDGLSEQRNTAGNYASFVSNNRNPYVIKPDIFSNRDVFENSYDYYALLNKMKRIPQTSISFYPFSWQNIDEYGYPRRFNRPYQYAPNLMARSESAPAPMEVLFQEDKILEPIPFYRDAENEEPLHNAQVIRRLVPVGYTSEVVSSGENYIAAPNSEDSNILLPNTFRSAIIPEFQPIPSILPSPKLTYVPLQQENPLNPLFNFMRNTNHNSSKVDLDSNEIQEKTAIIIQLLHTVPAFANEFYACLNASKVLKDVMKEVKDKIESGSKQISNSNDGKKN